MKVILIKDCKDGKANTIIEVSDGYGLNFLINKKFAVPYNERNKKMLDKKLSELTNDEIEKRQKALALKEKLENEILKFNRDAKVDLNGNLNVHGAVSTKDIIKSLSDLGYKLDKYAVQKVHLVQNGLHEIEIFVYKDITAKLKVEVKINVK